MIKILLADDHPLTLMGTKMYIDGLGYRICELCSNGISAYNMILTKQPDIAILDINMPGMNGIEVLAKISVECPKTKVILLTMHKEMSIFKRAEALNVQGYVLKEFVTDVLGDCIKAVLSGRKWFSKELTQRLQIDTNDGNTEGVESPLNALTFAEKKIITLIQKQHSTKEIAELLFISEKTVENHRHNILKKLQLPAGDRHALVRWAIANIKG
jgi:DNA-binding NarL/FixJ family response regulator